jgi:hypothetical protein
MRMEMEYRPNRLREYIRNSELRVVGDDFKVRLSPALAGKYDSGAYVGGIAELAGCVDEIKALGIRYPGRAHPVFYMYVVPDGDFVELLDYPFPDRKGGGRPVPGFDLDGFNMAYGTSQNMLEGMPARREGVSIHVNHIHEFAHLVHGQFFNRDRMVSEGFAEALPLYAMDYEAKFGEHRGVIKNMDPEGMITPRELLAMERGGSFGRRTRILGKSCSFDWAYVSSYLFVRGYIAMLAGSFGLGKVAATQEFLEIVRSSRYSSEWLVYDLADVVGMPRGELLDSRELQVSAAREIAGM